jgi:hypothetical protein
MDGFFNCKNDIQLEPRLQEYLKKKQFYRSNDIQAVVPLETEFGITSEDKRRLKAYLKGDNDIYNHKTQERFMDEALVTKFPSSEFKNDPRFERLQKKMQRDRDAVQQKNNFNLDNDLFRGNDLGFVDNYGHENSNNKGTLPAYTAFGSDDCENNFGIPEPKYVPSDSRMKNKYDVSKNKTNDKRFYSSANRVQDKPVNWSKTSFRDQYDFDVSPPEIQYNNRLYPNKNKSRNQLPHKSEVTGIIGELDSYANKVDKIYQHSSEMDTNLKIVIPNMNSNEKRCTATRYQAIPFMGRGDGIRNIDIESSMRSGKQDNLTTSSKKSHGFTNPAEHYFDYISNDIQLPEHTVMDMPRGGVSTRLDNHDNNMKYSRDIY